MTGIDWIPDEPVPMTPTLRPEKSTPSWGQRPVWNEGPANDPRPGMSGRRALERQPVAITQCRATIRSPRSVVTTQCEPASSNSALTTRVSNWIPLRRSRRSAT